MPPSYVGGGIFINVRIELSMIFISNYVVI